MMDVDEAALKNTCAGSNWTREDKAFEDALATYCNYANMWDKITSAVPSKRIEAIKELEVIESGKVTMPDYPCNVSVRKGKKKSQQAHRGTPWTEEEHRRFLYGFEKERTSCMPGCCNEKSVGAGTEEAATRAGNQLLPEHTTETSVDGEYQLRPVFPEKAPTETGNQLLQHGRPKRARTDVSNQRLPRLPFVGMSDISPISGSGSSTPLFRVFDVSSPSFAVKPVQEVGGPASPGGLAYLLEVPDHPPLESAPPASLCPYHKTWSSRLYEPSGLTSRLEITGHPTHTDKMARCYSTDAAMQRGLVQKAGGPTPRVDMQDRLALSDDDMARIYSTYSVIQDADGEVEIWCCPENMDLDLSLFPHFLD